MPTLTLTLIALAAATGPSLPHALERRLVAWGLLAAALGIGSVAVAASGDIRLTDLGMPSVAIDAGLQLLGALLLLAAGVRGWMLPPHRRIASVMLVAVGMALGWLARPLLATAGLAATGAAIATGAIGGGVIWLVTRGLHALPFRARSAPPATEPLPAWSRYAVALGLVGGAAAVVGPDAWIVVVGALGAALAAAVAPTAGRRPAPVLLVLAAVCLLPALWFMHTVAGPVGLRISSLDEVPFSPAAEAMLAPILALGAFGFFGLWPLRRWGRIVLVPVGVALLVRLGAAVPSGLEAWQTVLVPLGIVAACHAAFTADPVEAVGAWAWLAGVTGTRGAILLGAAALMLATAPGAARRAGALAGAWMGRAAWALAAAGGALALESVLRAQVVYAVMAALALVVLIGMPGGEPHPAR